MYKIKIHIDECDGCGECAEICPNEVIKMKDGKAVVSDDEECMGCDSCVESCQKGNITVEEI